MKRFAVKLSAVLLFIICMTSSELYVFAQESTEYFTLTTSKEEIAENEEVRISIIANNVDLQENIAGFRLNVKFDSTKLTLKRVDSSSQIQNGTFRYNVNEDNMIGIYVCDGTSAPKLTGECMTLIFRVNDGAVMGDTSVSVQIDQVVDWNAEQMPSVSNLTSIFILKPVFTREAILTKLVPNHGALEPSFDPYIQEYTLNVGAEVDQILFDLEAADEGTARVNRKNLGKQGSTTQFIVTVTSADKKNKSQYIVNVNRGEKEGAGSTSSAKSSSSKSSSSKSSAKSKTDGTKDEEDKGGNDIGEDTGTIFYGDRNLYIVGNQMPSYVMYMILGGIGILIICIVAAFIVIVRKKKK